MLIKTENTDLGYYLVDNRASGDLPPGCRTSVFEAPTYTCTHCERVVVMNPERKRDRYKCYSCNHNICDMCASELTAGKKCYPFKRYAEDMLEALSKLPQGSIIQSHDMPENPLKGR